eukprot:TRINITY_DN18493_c0_g1_i1.p1 TRINITY_DN18493_c0_g1~~TRINITY_DN18493_c0_g1_i1.p1  ORF type:complete len:142 (-),score=20.59 TRINITY_DN18493_c0_g1_i1:30-455(-)
MIVHVQTPSGKIISFEADSSLTLASLKEKISEAERVSIDQISLTLNDKSFDEKELSSSLSSSENVNIVMKTKPPQNKCVYSGCTKRPALIIGDCRFCGKKYCSQHRLPETHNCHNISDCRNQSYEKNKEKLMREKCVGIKV